VLIPGGEVFVMMPVLVSHTRNITFTIDGKILLSEIFDSWPLHTDFWHCLDSQDLTFRGSGVIDGRGYWWWWREIAVINKVRPHIFLFERVARVNYSGVKLMNSPQYHIHSRDILDFTFQNFEIHVDVQAQKRLLLKYGKWNLNLGIPTFPLNTDGIDPSGANIVIRNVTTVPPNNNNNCVRDVTFRNIRMEYPLKAIYVKTNPGNGSGIVSNITYLNIDIHKPIWWGIYIGPQQQKQPDGGGPGCMFYPVIKECPTQPRVTLENITLKNVKVTGSVLTPGIIRCHPDNPCKNFRFENVVHDAWYNKVGLGFITENVEGEVINSFPDPGFKRT
jgi:Glycosyl hydrolases family 28